MTQVPEAPEPAETAETAVHLHQDARVTGGGSAYQAGRDQVFHFEDGTRSAWRADPGAPDVQCPYPGLAAFGPEQAQWYFGRKQAIAHLCEEMAERLHRGGFLMVIGASGSGKSSLLRAGLVPAIGRGVLPEAGSARWPVAVFTPTAHPLGKLSGQLAQMADAASSSAGRLVLVVDQFEEAFTLCREEAERQDFISRLCQIARSGDGMAAAGLVVLGLRADFYAQAARYPLLRDALRDGPVLLDPMSEAELREAIIFPAHAVGLEIEPGLVEVLLRDLGVAQHGDRAGRLPLLAHALRATWQQRRGLLLTVDGYEATGGIERAIGTTADRAYDPLEAAGQEAARAMFLRLVAIGDSGNDTRRRLDRADLLRDFDEPGPANAVLDVFTQRRLLTQEQDTVVITHEALLYAWPRLQDWINSDRVGNIIRQDLDSAASSWERDGRDSAALYRGNRLVAARAWAATHGHDVSATTSAFLSASVRHENRAARTRRTAAILLTVLALLASVTAAFALEQRHQALVQRDQAIFGQIVTEASQLQATDPSLAAQLNLVAHRMQPGNADLYTSLINAENTPLPAVLAGNSGPVSSVAFSHDGRILGTTNWNHTIQLWNVANRGRPAKTGLPLQGNDGASGSLAFSSRGTLASALSSGVLLWNIADPAHPQHAGEAHSGSASSIVFSPDGRTLAVTVNNTVGLWNVADPAHPVAIGRPLRVTALANSAAFSPDGGVLAVGTSDNTVQLWNVRNIVSPIPIAKPLVGYEGNTSTGGSQQINSVAFSPDGKILASGSSNGLIRLWNLSRPDQPIPIGPVLNSHDGGVQSIAFSPDGDTLASGNNDDNVELWDVAYPASPFIIGRPLSGHAAEVDSVAFSPNGHILASASWDSTTRLWSIPPTVLNSPSSIDSVAFSQNGRVLAGGSYDGTIRLWNLSDPAHPALLGVPFASQSEAIWSLAFSPDGRVLATGSRDDTVRLWNIANPADPIPLTSPFNGGSGPIRSLFFARGGRILFNSGFNASSLKGTVRMWNVTNPARPSLAAQPLPAGLEGGFSMALSPDGRTLAVQYLVGVQLWNVTNPAHPVPVGKTPAQLTGVRAVAFGPDGILADGGFDNTIRLWNITNPARPAAIGGPIAGPTNTVLSIAFSRDGRILASGGQDDLVRLWNVSDPKHVTPIGNPLTGHINAIWSIAWSPNGKMLASGSIDGTVRLWDLRLPSAADWICSASTLTRSQWQHYIPELPYDPVCGQ